MFHLHIQEKASLPEMDGAVFPCDLFPGVFGGLRVFALSALQLR
jgi:hypothetical protein